MLTPSVRIRVSPSILGYLLVSVGLILAVLLPSTLIGAPGPFGYALSDYQILRFAPVVPLLSIALGAATVWSVNNMSKLRDACVLLSSGFVLTLTLFWVPAVQAGSYVHGLGFPLSWILLLALPLRPVEVLGTSVVAFLVDWVLWTLFIDSVVYVLERRRLRRISDEGGRAH